MIEPDFDNWALNMEKKLFNFSSMRKALQEAYDLGYEEGMRVADNTVSLLKALKVGNNEDI